MPQFETGAAAVSTRESEWETFRRLITHDDRNSYYIVSSNTCDTWEDVAVRKGNLPVLGFAAHASYYMTHNGFFAPNRRAESARQLNALFFDLDCHDRNTTETRTVVDQTLAAINKAVATGKLVEPTMIVDSGRGLQLFYVLRRSVPVYFNGTRNDKSIAFFETVQRKMASVFEKLLSPIDGISVDRATGDISRVSRIPGTYNKAAGRMARLVAASEVMHSLSDLSSFATKFLLTNEIATAVAPARQLKHDHKHNHKHNRATIMQYKPLMMSRLAKLMELQAYRNYDCTGTRELMNFVFYNTAVQIYEREDARRRLRSFNSRFCDPLCESELMGVEKSVDEVVNYQGEKGYYLIGAARLIDFIGLTESENQAIGFFESKRAIERTAAKRATAQAKADRNAKIIELRQTTSMTQQEIAQTVGVSLRTVASVLAKTAAHKRRAKLQELTVKPSNASQTAIAKYNKEHAASYNKKYPQTCNFLSYESLKYSPASVYLAKCAFTLPLALSTSSFYRSNLWPLLNIKRKASMTKSFASGTSVTETWVCRNSLTSPKNVRCRGSSS